MSRRDTAAFEAIGDQVSDKPIKVYLAGPMTGYPEYNFPAFHAVAAYLRAYGYEVFNPAENDLKNGFDPKGLKGTEAEEYGFNLRQTLKEDLSWICDHADAIALHGLWNTSAGVKAEVSLAQALKIPVLDYTQFTGGLPNV